MLKFLLTLCCIVGLLTCVKAQDPQYSQFYANPLYLSPAFAGSSLTTRATANYRLQWPGLEATYATYAASMDHYFARINSGVGLLVTHDRQGFARYNSTDIGAQYAYQLQLGEVAAFRAGLQLSYVMRSVNYNGLTFGEQFTDRGPTGGPITDPYILNADGGIKNYLDVSSGGLFYTDKLWLGFSAHHLTRPNQSFIGNKDFSSRLPIKFTVHGGYKFFLENDSRQGLARDVTAREKSFSLAGLYKAQGKFDQLDLGAYFTFEPVVLGMWYRGLPIKKYEQSINNSDALIFLVGFKQEGLSIGYSYDMTISNLGFSTGGAHEVSVSYEFPAPQARKRLPRSARKLPCPKF